VAKVGWQRSFRENALERKSGRIRGKLREECRCIPALLFVSGKPVVLLGRILLAENWASLQPPAYSLLLAFPGLRPVGGILVHEFQVGALQ
jgi:hypothetical protein